MHAHTNDTHLESLKVSTAWEVRVGGGYTSSILASRMQQFSFSCEFFLSRHMHHLCKASTHLSVSNHIYLVIGDPSLKQSLTYKVQNVGLKDNLLLADWCEDSSQPL